VEGVHIASDMLKLALEYHVLCLHFSQTHLEVLISSLDLVLFSFESFYFLTLSFSR
jgi:hypothetical protein